MSDEIERLKLIRFRVHERSHLRPDDAAWLLDQLAAAERHLTHLQQENADLDRTVDQLHEQVQRIGAEADALAGQVAASARAGSQALEEAKLIRDVADSEVVQLQRELAAEARAGSVLRQKIAELVRDAIPTRAIVQDAFYLHPDTKTGPRRLGHNPSWVKAAALSTVVADTPQEPTK